MPCGGKGKAKGGGKGSKGRHKIIRAKGGKFRIRNMKGKAGTKKAMRKRLAAYHINKGR